MSIEQILIAGICAVTTALVSVVGLLWGYVVKPLLDEMFALIRAMKVEMPEQTEQLRVQTGFLKAAKHASAEHLRLQKIEMEKLDAIAEAVQAGACRQGRP